LDRPPPFFCGGLRAIALFAGNILSISARRKWGTQLILRRAPIGERGCDRGVR